MKKLTLCVLVILFGVAMNANASLFTAEDTDIYGTWDASHNGYWGAEWSGYYIGYFAENDSEDLLKSLAETYLGEALTSVAYSKVDPLPGDGGILYADGVYNGTWSVDSPYALGFYAVKAGPQFALYYVDPYQTSGIWSTIHLTVGKDQMPEISHLSALAETAPVPEPATLILLGSGLLGLAGVRRKIKK